MPSVQVEGVISPLLHVSQLRSLLGLSMPDYEDTVRYAYDTVPVLEAWIAHIETLDWELLNAPTPSRDRTLRELTVNVFHPFDLLPTAWSEGDFDWRPEDDPVREAALTTPEALADYARQILLRWNSFLLTENDRLETTNPNVTSPRGELTFSSLLASQRWHCSFHYRQMMYFLEPKGLVMPGAFRVESITDIDLPESVF